MSHAPPPHPHRRRRRVRLAATVTATVSAVLLSLLVAAPGQAQPIDTGTYYVLQSQHSGKVMEVDGGAQGDGGELVQRTRTDAAHQQFRFLDSGGGWYRIQARHSGKVLDVWDWSEADGARIVQWADLGGANQQFRFEDSGGGNHRLINRHSGKALDVWERSTSDGARISQYTDLNGTNQQWSFRPADGSGGGDNPQNCGGGSFHAEAVQSGGNWTARNGNNTVYTGNDMLAAMRAAVNSLSPGRTSQQRVVVRGSGSMAANQSLDLPSHTSLEVCGTINATGSASGSNAVIRARNVTNVAVPHLTVTGGPWFGIFVQNSSNVHLGQINLRLSGGLGIRVDNHGNRNVRTTNVRMDDVYVSGTNNHGVETYGVDGLTIGTVTARDTAYSGLLLNDTINATVARVDAQGAGTGTGYAAFRMANRNGRVGDSYPTNIRVGEVIARGGGRGIFCVSESGGAVIDRIDIAGTGNNAILVENCYNVNIGAQGGTVRDRDIRIAARSEFPNTRDITIQNLTVTNSAITENPCGINITFRNITRVNSSLNVC
ncbi:RICIN domain-containing protein [Streptomyces sp. ACA25]|uniref:RICIN domain-containing protein n=1 Tax=Streptomyces sp. ACA25 TaxID=3022596 RepID=UPI002FE2C1A6